MKKSYIKASDARRRNRVRLSVRSKGRVRLSVFRSCQYIYAQLIDDRNHRTLAAASSLEKEAPLGNARLNCAAAEWVGRSIAERGIKAGIKSVVFDRGSYRFHGRLKALAEGARSVGLDF